MLFHMKFEKRQRYAIRKFSVGAASVLIGQFYLGSVANAPVVHANEITQQAPEASSSESNTSSSESASTEAASLAGTETSAESVSVDKSKLQLTYQTFINLMKEEVNLSDKTTDSVAAYKEVRAYAEELQLKAEELLLNGDATAEAVEAMNKELVSITAKLSRAMRSLEVVAQPAPEVKTEASVEKSETKTSESSAKESKTEVASEKTSETKAATAKEEKTEKVVNNKPTESKQEEKSSEAGAESAAHRELTEAVTKAEASVQEAEKELTTKEVEEATRKHLLGTVENAKLQIQAAKTSLQEPNQTDIELNRSLGQLRSSIEAVYTELKKVGVSSSANKEDQVATGRKRTKRSTETPVSPNKPYITIERQYGPSYDRAAKDYTVVKNGDILDIKYKTGTTRIAATDVELTPDAKALGLSYDPVAGYITGRVVLNAAFQSKTYEIGLMSKADNSIKTTADLNIRPHHGFVLNGNFNYIVNKTAGTNDPYYFTLTEINGNRATSYDYDGPKFLKDDGTDILTYRMTLPVTPFGYYLPLGTIENATSDTKQYKMGIQVAALGKADNYTKAPTIKKIEVVNNPANIAFEYKNVGNETPLGYSEYTPNNYSPYYIEFTRLPKTAGKYTITFKTTDSLGLVRTFVVNITTVEKSQDGFLTNADIRFKPTTEQLGKIETPDPSSPYRKITEPIAQIPSSMDEQEIGEIELNKENASILPIRFPDGVEYDATTRMVKKKAGTRLAPGKYTFEAKAVDGHFGNNAPTRIMTFEVIDGVNPIAHQVWKENKEISALPVTLAHGSRIKEVKIINQGPEHADLYVDQATHTIKGSGVKRTTANQTVNVEVSYYNAEGGITKTTTTFTYEVQPGDPVTDVTVDVSNAEQTVKEGEQIKPMVITATPGADVRVSNLPAGLTYNADTKTITGVGVKEGVYTFPVMATKDGKVARKEAKLTVTAGQLVALDYNYEYTLGEPITPFTIAKAADTEFSMEYSYDLAHGGFLINGQPLSTRIEGQVGDITFSGTPTEIMDYNGTYTLRRTLSTGEVQTATGRINLTVKGLPIEAPSAQTTVQVGKPLSLTLTPQVGTKVTIDTNSLPNGVTYDENTNTFSGTPTTVGTFNIQTTAQFTDPSKSGNPPAYGQVQINVTAKPLTVTGQEKTVTAGDALPPVTIETSEGATIDGGVSRYLPRGVTFDSATKTFSGTPMEVGTFRIPLVAKYPEYSLHPSASATFILHVKSRAVSVADESRSGEVLKPITPLTLNVSNGAKVTFDESLLPPGVTYNSNTKTFSGNPTKVGTYVVPVTASYPGISGNDEARGTVTFTVTPQAPSIAISNNNQTVKLGEAIQSAVVTHNPNAALSIRLPYGSVEEEDINDYLATYGLSYDASTNTITGTPNKVGTLTFKYRAKNPADLGGGSADETFTLTVQDTAVQVDVNQARQLVRLGSRMKDVVLTPTAGATLTVDTTKLPSGVTYDQTTKTFSGKPGAAGSYEIPVTATLGESTVTRTVVIDVVDLKDGTSIHSGAADPTSTTGKDGDTYVNTTTGDTFIKNGDTWVKNGNVKGPQGAKGDKGEDGAAGAKGDKGEDGTSITITKTEPQANGDVKVTFSDGKEIIVPKGAKGDKGEDGTSITITKTEPQANGDVKVTFSDGREIIVPKGAKGDKGEDGAAGAKGQDGTSITITKTEPQANGDVKVTFSDGKEIIVPKGAKGDKGDTGAQGPKGDKGDTGAQGPKGDKGDTGASGRLINGNGKPNNSQGNDGDLYYDKGTGQLYYKENGVWVPLNLKGQKGDKGDTGAQGPKGDKGDKGDTGAQGPKGDKGDKGDTGAQGPKGDTGATGQNGINGGGNNGGGNNGGGNNGGGNNGGGNNGGGNNGGGNNGGGNNGGGNGSNLNTGGLRSLSNEKDANHLSNSLATATKLGNGAGKQLPHTGEEALAFLPAVAWTVLGAGVLAYATSQRKKQD